MTELNDKVSNFVCDSDWCSSFIIQNGNSIISSGDEVVLDVGFYSCRGGTCAHSGRMLWSEELHGTLAWEKDAAECILAGDNSRRVISVEGTGGGILSFRAITFKDGEHVRGSGIFIQGNSIIEIFLCVFRMCRATSIDSGSGGGAIYLNSGSTGGEPTVNVYGTSFIGNTADSENGGDIYQESGNLTIHNTCPPPYTTNTPVQGTSLNIFGTVVGSTNSYTDCAVFVCSAGFYNPECGGSISACEVCPAGKYSLLGAVSCVDCVPGRYSNKVGANFNETCTACPPGSIQRPQVTVPSIVLTVSPGGMRAPLLRIALHSLQERYQSNPIFPRTPLRAPCAVVASFQTSMGRLCAKIVSPAKVRRTNLVSCINR